MHQNNSMSDALLLRQGNLAALRDAIFLQNRWLPPGLRLIGLPIAAAFWDQAPTALRIAAAVLTLLPLPIIWFGLRPVAGAAGADRRRAAVRADAAEPGRGAKLHDRDGAAPRRGARHDAAAAGGAGAAASALRLALLGPVLGLGALSKLTFLPTIGIVWVGVAAWRLWRDRDAAAFALRLAVPSIGLALVAWPHYLLNIPRYLAYAKATAGGYAYNPVAATGLDFAVYAVGDLVWEVFGLGGTALLLAGWWPACSAGGGCRRRSAPWCCWPCWRRRHPSSASSCRTTRPSATWRSAWSSSPIPPGCCSARRCGLAAGGHCSRAGGRRRGLPRWSNWPWLGGGAGRPGRGAAVAAAGRGGLAAEFRLRLPRLGRAGPRRAMRRARPVRPDPRGQSADLRMPSCAPASPPGRSRS